MKKILLTLTFLILSASTFGQHTYCHPSIWPYGDPDGRPINFAFEPQAPTAETPDETAYPDTHPEKQYVYKVVFHVVTDENHQRSTGNVGESEVMDAIRDLNLAYNQFDIFFKYGGFDYFADSSLQGDIGEVDLLATFPSITNEDWFHITILDGDIVNQTGEHVPGKGYQWSTVAFVSFDGLTNSRVLPHEVGHCFYLYHDFSTDEHVTRIAFNAGYNAPISGDRVWDTPASKIWEMNQYNSNWEYVGSDIDTNILLPANDTERFYKTYAPRLNNFMHVHDGNSLQAGYFFTPGQGRRMRWAMDYAIANNYPMYAHAEVDVKELYQPFDSQEIAGDIVSVSDKDDETAIVCRERIRIDRFQKGFNYTFSGLAVYENGEIINVPNDLTVIGDQTDNYNVRIAQVGEQVEEVEVICTRGPICSEEEFESGFVFVLGMIGSPIDIIELNQIQTRNPALYLELLQQYYNVVRRITTTGAVSDKIIYKP